MKGEGWAPPFISCAQDTVGLLTSTAPIANRLWETFTFFSPLFIKHQIRDDKLHVCKFSLTVSSKIYHFENSETRGQTDDLDEAAHHELPHQDLHCLQMQLFLSLVLKVNIKHQ